jgi:hypothetical protein
MFKAMALGLGLTLCAGSALAQAPKLSEFDRSMQNWIGLSSERSGYQPDYSKVDWAGVIRANPCYPKSCGLRGEVEELKQQVETLKSDVERLR